MKITVLLFGPLGEAASPRLEDFELPEGSRVADLRAALESRFPAAAPGLANAAVAVNASYCRGDHLLGAGDEVALIPPVSGG